MKKAADLFADLLWMLISALWMTMAFIHPESESWFHGAVISILMLIAVRVGRLCDK